jgi:hypothetical protein
MEQMIWMLVKMDSLQEEMKGYNKKTGHLTRDEVLARRDDGLPRSNRGLSGD